MVWWMEQSLELNGLWWTNGSLKPIEHVTYMYGWPFISATVFNFFLIDFIWRIYLDFEQGKYSVEWQRGWKYGVQWTFVFRLGQQRTGHWIGSKCSSRRLGSNWLRGGHCRQQTGSCKQRLCQWGQYLSEDRHNHSLHVNCTIVRRIINVLKSYSYSIVVLQQ